MNISVDGGALCSPFPNRFGTYSFSKSIITALGLYDIKNQYDIYTFCDSKLQLFEHSNIHIKKLMSSVAWNSLHISIEELRKKHSTYLALNQAIPWYVSSPVLSFSHGLSFMYFPQFYQDSYWSLKKQLKSMIDRSAHCIVSSIQIKHQMQSLFPQANNISVLPFGIPFDILNFSVCKPIQKEKYFLYVGMNHPIKNIPFLIRAFTAFRTKKKDYSSYKLLLVGDHKQYEDRHQHILSLGFHSRKKLISLYQKAVAYVSASYYESFNLPVLEALACGCNVIALSSALIPELYTFCYHVDDIREFVEQMEACSTLQKDIDVEKLSRQFSWERYVRKLISLY